MPEEVSLEAARESIFGLDSIRLALPVAGPGGRSLATLLDYLCLGVVLFLWVLLCLVLSTVVHTSWLVAILVGGLFLIEWGYFAGMEVATGGRTLGKLALKLRVVTAEGARPGPMPLVVRNLVRDIDLLIGVPLMAVDPLARRLGDRLAGTVVVHELQGERELILGRVPPGWTAREVEVVESFLLQAPQLADERTRWELAGRLLRRVAHDAPDFLAGAESADRLQALRVALAVSEG